MPQSLTQIRTKKENTKRMSKFELKMPKMGESITEGTIINWLVQEGDSFEEGDILLEVATDKVDNEVPAPVSGTITKLMFQAKDVVAVGQVIAVLEASETSKSLEGKSKKQTVTSSAVEMSHKNEKQSISNSTKQQQSYTVTNS